MKSNNNKIKTDLLNSQGEYWKTQRSATNPIMARPQKVLSYLPKQNRVVDEFLHLLELKMQQDNTLIDERFQINLKYINLERTLHFSHQYNFSMI